RVADVAHRIDAAFVCLHGAMAGFTQQDPEGQLLTTLRSQLGPKPIVASLDLHAVLTEPMRRAADILVPYHTYPHVDHWETGCRSARLLAQLLAGRITPTTACIPLPMLVRGDELLTRTGLFGRATRRCAEIEASPGGLAAGVLIGNAFTDVPGLQSYVLVTTDQDPERAEREALALARFMWGHRHQFQARLTPLADALAQAEGCPGLTALSDGADATASGAPGDSNAILRGIVERPFLKRSLVPLVDAPAVSQAWAAGVGQSVPLLLGGTRDPRFKPLPLTVTVRSLHEGDFHYEDGTPGRAGRAAVLVHGPVTLLVTERPVYVVGRRVFQAHGVEPADFDLVVVKSPNGYRTWYESIARQMIPVDVPGATSANLRSLPYRQCVRPIFPLDDVADPPWYHGEN
ncbi:MAG: M81 family metallopeptidase, partial [Pirellulaceae bacterium]